MANQNNENFEEFLQSNLYDLLDYGKDSEELKAFNENKGTIRVINTARALFEELQENPYSISAKEKLSIMRSSLHDFATVQKEAKKDNKLFNTIGGINKNEFNEIDNDAKNQKQYAYEIKKYAEKLKGDYASLSKGDTIKLNSIIASLKSVQIASSDVVKEALDNLDSVVKTMNTNAKKTVVKKNKEDDVKGFIDFATHHTAIVTGRNAQVVQKIADLASKSSEARHAMMEKESASETYTETASIDKINKELKKAEKKLTVNKSKFKSRPTHKVKVVNYTTGFIGDKQWTKVSKEKLNNNLFKEAEKSIATFHMPKQKLLKDEKEHVVKGNEYNAGIGQIEAAIQQQIRNNVKGNKASQQMNNINYDKTASNIADKGVVVDFEATFQKENGGKEDYDPIKHALTTFGVSGAKKILTEKYKYNDLNYEEGKDALGAIIFDDIQQTKERLIEFLRSTKKGAEAPRNELAKKLGLGDAYIDKNGEVYYKDLKGFTISKEDIVKMLEEIYLVPMQEAIKKGKNYVAIESKKNEYTGRDIEAYNVVTDDFIDKVIKDSHMYGASTFDPDMWNAKQEQLGRKDRKFNMKRHHNIFSSIIGEEDIFAGGWTVENIAKILLPKNLQYDPTTAHGESMDAYYEGKLIEVYDQNTEKVGELISNLKKSITDGYFELYGKDAKVKEDYYNRDTGRMEQRYTEQYREYSKMYIENYANLLQGIKTGKDGTEQSDIENTVLAKADKNALKQMKEMANDDKKFVNAIEKEINDTFGEEYAKYFKGDVTKERIAKRTGRKKSQVNLESIKDKLVKLKQVAKKNNLYVDAQLIDDRGIKKLKVRLLRMDDYKVNPNLIDTDRAIHYDIELADGISRRSEFNDSSVTMLNKNEYTGDLTDSIHEDVDAGLRRIEKFIPEYARNDINSPSGAAISSYAESSGKLRRNFAPNVSIKSDKKLSGVEKERLQASTSWLGSLSTSIRQDKGLRETLHYSLSNDNGMYNTNAYDKYKLNPSIVSDMMAAKYMLANYSPEELERWRRARISVNSENGGDIKKDFLFQLMNTNNKATRKFREDTMADIEKGIIVTYDDISSGSSQSGISSTGAVDSNKFQYFFGIPGTDTYRKTTRSGIHNKGAATVEELNKIATESGAKEGFWHKNTIDEYDAEEEALQAQVKIGLLPTELINRVNEKLGTHRSMHDDQIFVGSDFAKTLEGPGIEKFLDPIKKDSYEETQFINSLKANLKAQTGEDGKQKYTDDEVNKIIDNLQNNEDAWMELEGFVLKYDLQIGDEIVKAGEKITQVRNNKGRLQLQYKQKQKATNASKVIGTATRASLMVAGNNEKDLTTEEMKKLLIGELENYVNEAWEERKKSIEDRIEFLKSEDPKKNADEIEKLSEHIKNDENEYKSQLTEITKKSIEENDIYKALDQLPTDFGMGSEFMKKYTDTRTNPQYLIPTVQRLLENIDAEDRRKTIKKIGILNKAFKVNKNGTISRNKDFNWNNESDEHYAYVHSIEYGEGKSLIYDLWIEQYNNKITKVNKEIKELEKFQKNGEDKKSKIKEKQEELKKLQAEKDNKTTYYADATSGLIDLSLQGKVTFFDSEYMSGIAGKMASDSNETAAYHQNVSGVKRQYEEGLRQKSWMMDEIGIDDEEYDKYNKEFIENQLIENKEERLKADLYNFAALSNRSDSASKAKALEWAKEEKYGKFTLGSSLTNNDNLRVTDYLDAISTKGPEKGDYFTAEEFEKSIFNNIYFDENNKEREQIGGKTDVVLKGAELVEKALGKANIVDEEERGKLRKFYKEKGMYDDIHFSLNRLDKNDETGEVKYDESMMVLRHALEKYDWIKNQNSVEDAEEIYRNVDNLKRTIQNEQANLGHNYAGKSVSLRGAESGYLKSAAGEEFYDEKHTKRQTLDWININTAKNIMSVRDTDKLEDIKDYAKSLDFNDAVGNKLEGINDKYVKDMGKAIEAASKTSNVTEAARETNKAVEAYVNGLAKWAATGKDGEEKQKRRTQVAQKLNMLTSRSPYLSNFSLASGRVFIEDDINKSHNDTLFISPGDFATSGLFNADYDGDILSIKKQIAIADKEGNKKKLQFWQKRLEYRKNIIDKMNATFKEVEATSGTELKSFDSYNKKLKERAKLVTDPMLEKSLDTFIMAGNQSVGIANYQNEMFNSAIAFYREDKLKNKKYSEFDMSADMTSDFLTQLGQQTGISSKKVSDLMVAGMAGGNAAVYDKQFAIDLYNKTDELSKSGKWKDAEDFSKQYEGFLETSLTSSNMFAKIAEAEMNFEHQLENKSLSDEDRKNIQASLNKAKELEDLYIKITQDKVVTRDENGNATYRNFTKAEEDEWKATGKSKTIFDFAEKMTSGLNSGVNFASYIKNNQALINEYANGGELRDIIGMRYTRIFREGDLKSWKEEAVQYDENGNTINEEDVTQDFFAGQFAQIIQRLEQMVTLLGVISQQQGGGGGYSKSSDGSNKNYLYDQIVKNIAGMSYKDFNEKFQATGGYLSSLEEISHKYKFDLAGRSDIDALAAAGEVIHATGFAQELLGNEDRQTKTQMHNIYTKLNDESVDKVFDDDYNNFVAWQHNDWKGQGYDKAASLVATSLAGNLQHGLSAKAVEDLQNNKVSFEDLKNKDSEYWNNMSSSYKGQKDYQRMVKLMGSEEMVDDYLEKAFGGVINNVFNSIASSKNGLTEEQFKHMAVETPVSGLIQFDTGEKDENGENIKITKAYAATVDRAYQDEKTGAVVSQDLKFKETTANLSDADIIEGVFQQFAILQDLKDFKENGKTDSKLLKKIGIATEEGVLADGKNLDDIINATEKSATQFLKVKKGQVEKYTGAINLESAGGLERTFAALIQYLSKYGGDVPLTGKELGASTLDKDNINRLGYTPKGTIEKYQEIDKEINQLNRIKREMQIGPYAGTSEANDKLEKLDKRIKKLDEKKQELEDVMSSDKKNKNTYDDFKSEYTGDIASKDLQQQVNLTTQLKNITTGLLSNVMGFGAATKVMQTFGQSVNKVVQYAKELDKKLVDLQIATGKTKSETYDMLQDFNSLASDMGRTTTQVADAANDWLRAGYKGKEATDLITSSMYLSTLGMMSATDATKSLISVLKGWKLESSDVIGVVDKLVTGIKKQRISGNRYRTQI